MEKYNSGQEIFSIEVDNEAKNDFIDMARWTKFLAILGMVGLGLMLLLAVFISLFLSVFAEQYGGPSATAIASLGALGPVFVILFFLIIIGINIYPMYALLRYSTSIKTAVNTGNREKFNEAIKYLKKMFRYMGVLAVIVLALYGLQIIIAIITGMGR